MSNPERNISAQIVPSPANILDISAFIEYKYDLAMGLKKPEPFNDQASTFATNRMPANSVFKISISNNEGELRDAKPDEILLAR